MSPATPETEEELDMAVVIVEERFEPPIDLSQGSPVADKISPCLPVYDVAWLSSYIASDGTRCVCVYEAESTTCTETNSEETCTTTYDASFCIVTSDCSWFSDEWSCGCGNF